MKKFTKAVEEHLKNASSKDNSDEPPPEQNRDFFQPSRRTEPATAPRLLSAVQERALFKCVADMNKTIGDAPVEVEDSSDSEINEDSPEEEVAAAIAAHSNELAGNSNSTAADKDIGQRLLVQVLAFLSCKSSDPVWPRDLVDIALKCMEMMEMKKREQCAIGNERKTKSLQQWWFRVDKATPARL